VHSNDNPADIANFIIFFMALFFKNCAYVL
jgi:hypothetical protein